ncbi:hypothetical protein AVEN_90442-1 [Araneus ventricosus]|uniref:Uncharacterized protein n=1 Tax=Araneus ventricosus TaxID=182803 RepID=A0A4Y2PKR4_ARAVE|nr:hypothetical protein AVEN_90442-1 [Araneus ventricosus]
MTGRRDINTGSEAERTIAPITGGTCEDPPPPVQVYHSSSAVGPESNTTIILPTREAGPVSLSVGDADLMKNVDATGESSVCSLFHRRKVRYSGATGAFGHSVEGNHRPDRIFTNPTLIELRQEIG